MFGNSIVLFGVRGSLFSFSFFDGLIGKDVIFFGRVGVCFGVFFKLNKIV